MITTGISTLATATPASESAVSSRNTAVPPAKERASRPRVIAPIPAVTTAIGPIRRASTGAAKPKAAKQSEGTAVSRPATVALMPRSSRTRSSSGPRLVTTGRRLNAATAMATANSAERYVARACARCPVRGSAGASARGVVRVSAGVSAVGMNDIIE